MSSHRLRGGAPEAHSGGQAPGGTTAYGAQAPAPAQPAGPPQAGAVTSSERIRILFVDDEPRLLEGLVRMLRPLRDQWEVSTAPSGDEALAVLAARPFDVIVSDMRMPGMNGAQLLFRVAEEHPEIVRFILTGQSDRESLLQAMETTHRFLAKPCDPELLKDAINRAIALRRRLDDPAITTLVSQLGALPSVPDLYVRICTELRSETCSVKVVGDLVMQDIGLSAKVLQLANAAGFGVGRQVSSASEAVTMLGIDLLRTLVLADHVFRSTVTLDWRAERMWDHCVHVAALARAIARHEGQSQDLANAAFTAGLLHDCGHVLVDLLPDHEAAAANGAVGMHAQIGAYLLGLWGLPDALVEAVAYHHEPSRCEATGITPLTMVHAAEGVILGTGAAFIGDAKPIDEDYLGRLGLAGRMDAWRALLGTDAMEGA